MLSSSVVLSSVRPRWDMMVLSANPTEEPGMSSLAELSHSILENILVMTVRERVYQHTHHVVCS